MTNNQSDTIVALATPAGRGGVGIVRVSGKQVLEITQAMIGREIHARQAIYTSFYDQEKQLIDQGLAIYFQGPNSYTGEDVLELQGHGGPYIMDMLIETILGYGARLANPGEFTERAFLNDKIDLVQAEAVADLIDAGSREAARCAAQSLNGAFSDHIHELTEAMIQLRIFVEAAIDFPEEEIDFLADQRIGERINDLIARVETTLETANQGAILRDGINAVIVGKPNAGKSSLLNALSGQETAIVTHIEGTTRDVLREEIQIDGIPVHITDTAGIRQANDEVEKIGIERAKKEVAKADLILLVVDQRTEQSGELTSAWPEQLARPDVPVIRILNKIDLTETASGEEAREDGFLIRLSAKFGDGVDVLKQRIKTLVGYQDKQEGQFIARRRHIHALTTCLSHLEQAKKQFESKQGELIAEELRLGQQNLNEITGEFSSDDLLGRIFSSFCIGK